MAEGSTLLLEISVFVFHGAALCTSPLDARTIPVVLLTSLLEWGGELLPPTCLSVSQTVLFQSFFLISWRGGEE